MARFRLLQPHLENGIPLARIARDQGIVLRTAQRWLRCYRAQGLAGLARAPRADRGTRTFPSDLVRLIEGVALQLPTLSVAAIHRRAVAVATERDWPVPSYSAVYGIIRRLHPGIESVAIHA